MASKRKSSSQGGSTLYGVLAGLLIGLILAAAVAFYVTKAPMPFVDRATRQASGPEKPIDPRTAPDPNQGLYGRDGAAGTPPTGPTATAPTPLPDGKTDDLGALIATLPSADQAAAPLPVPVPAAPAPSKPPPRPSRPRRPPASRPHRPPSRPMAITICRPGPIVCRPMPSPCGRASCCWACP